MTDEAKKGGKRPRMTEADLQELIDLIGPPPAAPFPTYDRDGSSDGTPDWDTREVPRRGRGDHEVGKEPHHEGRGHAGPDGLKPARPGGRRPEWRPDWQPESRGHGREGKAFEVTGCDLSR